MKKILLTLTAVLAIAGVGFIAFAGPSQGDIMHMFANLDASSPGAVIVSNGEYFYGRSSQGVLAYNRNGVSSLANPTVPGTYALKLVKDTFDIRVNSGVVGSYALNATVPAHAMFVNSWIEVVEPIVSVGNNGTIAFSCEDANNLFTATDIDGSAGGALLSGAAAPASLKGDIAADCRINVTIGTNNITYGKINVYALYAVGEF